MAAPSRIRGHRGDVLDDGPLKEPHTIVQGQKVYRKESCTLDHRVRAADGGIAHSVPARKYFGLWQCGCCGGLIAPSLRRKARTITLGKYNADAGHANGNGNGARGAA